VTTFARLSRADRKEQTRRALLEAGRALFVRDGFHGTTLDRIAAEAGFTKGAVYASFPTKADLFLAIFEARVDERVPRIRAFGARARSLDAFSKAMIRDWQRVLRDEHEWSLVLIEFWVYAARTPELRDRLETQRHRIRNAVVEAARDAGGEEVLEMDLEEFMSAQLALANGYNLEALLEPARAPARFGRASQALFEGAARR
jgi:AcrR family transcriptional regulator